MTFDDKNKDVDLDLDDGFMDDLHEEKPDIEKLKEQVRSFSNDMKVLDVRGIEPSNSGLQNTEGSNIDFGAMIVSKGYITQDQLEIAMREKKGAFERKELISILIELNFISDSSVSKILKDASGIDTVDLTSYPIDKAIVRQIPRSMAVQYNCVPLEIKNDVLYAATFDVYNVIAQDMLRRYFNRSLKLVVYYASQLQISEVIDQFYDDEINIQAILKEIETGTQRFSIEDDTYINPTVRLVDSIFHDAVKLGASDIHFEPENEFVRVRYRIDGVLVQMFSFHKQFWSAIMVRVKVMSGMNIAETRNPQDGRITLMVMGRKIDYRMSAMPTIHGENIVARILDQKKSLMELTDLGLSPEQYNLLNRLIRRPEGVIVVTGPTGSGKTTTLYSILSKINSMNINIMTLEDPVEYQLPIIRQSMVREGTNVSFDNGVRTLMRQDPDVIFVGEIRDNETATMTMRAAMTGHQVYTTLHTNDSLGVIPRLFDLGVKPSILAGNMICAMAQRLARKLCNHCKAPYSPSQEERKILGIAQNAEVQIYKHKGCDRCYNTGYRGRVAIYEILPVDREFDDLIARSATRKQLLDYARSKGFKTMADEGLAKIAAGVTDFAEIIDTVDLTEYLGDVDLPI